MCPHSQLMQASYSFSKPYGFPPTSTMPACPKCFYLSQLPLLETSLTLALSSSPALSETLLTPRLFPHKMLSKSNCPLAETSLEKPFTSQISYPEHPTLSPQDLPSPLVVHLEIQYSFLEALNHFVTCANEKKCSVLTCPLMKGLHNEMICCGITIIRKDLASPWLLDSH